MVNELMDNLIRLANEEKVTLDIREITILEYNLKTKQKTYELRLVFKGESFNEVEVAADTVLNRFHREQTKANWKIQEDTRITGSFPFSTAADKKKLVYNIKIKVNQKLESETDVKEN